MFGLPASTDVARVLACLFEKDVEFQLVRIDTYKGEHKVPEFLKLQAHFYEIFFPIILMPDIVPLQIDFFSFSFLQDPSGQVTFKDGKTTLTSMQCFILNLARLT